MLEVKTLNVRHGMTEILRSVSFAVPDNEIVALLGGNGSGKTTLINTLSGTVKARSGSVTVAGQDATNRSAHQMVKMGVMQVPQGREIFGAMTVRENLQMGASTRNDRRSIEDDIEEMLNLFPALRPLQSRKAGTLSGGQQQQLAIGRALMSRPRLLLLDEPSAGLSPNVVQSLVGTIKMLRDRGLTILLVEQNIGVAGAVAGQAHVLMGGEIAHSAPARDLVRSPELLASYLGR
jgi:branched-chain amino acid transport system ATP-binding protein